MHAHTDSLKTECLQHHSNSEEGIKQHATSHSLITLTNVGQFPQFCH